MRRIADITLETGALKRRTGTPPLRSVIVASVAVLALAGCSSVPEELNPIVWAEAVDDFVTGEDESLDPEFERRVEAERARPVPGADQPFPSLDGVPSEAPDITSYEQRRAIADSLVADRENARYSDQPARPATQTTNVRPTRPASPATTVTPGRLEPANDRLAPERDIAAVRPGRAVYEDRSAVVPAPRYEAPAVAARAQTPPPQARQAAPQRGPISVVQEVYKMFARSGGLVTQLPPQQASAYAGGASPAPGNAVVATAAPAYPGTYATDAVPNGRSTVSFDAAERYHAAVIYYGHGSSRLSAKDKEVLRQVAHAHREYGGRVRIVGHASSRTRTNDVLDHKMANYAISQKRAGLVAEELSRHGVARESLVIEALADTAPGYSEATPHGEAANRRTDVFLEFSS